MSSISTRIVVCSLVGIAFVSASFADTKVPTPTTRPFIHPGVLVNRAQLDFIKSKIQSGAQPWKSAFEAAKASDYGSLSYTPKPRAAVECGPYSKPDLGCKDEQRDSVAAYTQALLIFAAEVGLGIGSTLDGSAGLGGVGE